MASGIDRVVKIALGEAGRHRRLVVAGFVATLSVASIIGLGWPKTYTSYTTVLVEDVNILGSLMEGTAVQDGLVDRGRVAREIIGGHRILSQVVASEPWPAARSPAHLQGMMARVRGNTVVTNVGESLIRIEYSDTDPERAFQGAQRMAEYFVQESLDAKASDSRSAFEFVNRQARDYGRKMEAARAELERFRESNADLRGTTPERAREQVYEIAQELETLRRTLREAQVRKTALEQQLRGESSTLSADERVDAVTLRIAELRSELAELRRRYHDSHPDVAQVQEQIAELQGQARSGTGSGVGGGLTALNPIHQQMRQDLYRTSADIAAIQASVGAAESALEEARSRVKRLETVEAQLGELARAFEVNQDLYQDLLQRRERARLSLDLTQEKPNQPLRVAEPAFLPHSAQGLELLHFVVGGTILGAILPIAGLIGWQQANPRVRDRRDLVDGLEVPVMAAVPHYATPSEQRARARGTAVIAVVVGTAVLIAVSLVILRTQGVI